MSEKIDGLFLRSTKLKQHSLIVDLYTFQHGRSSFVFTHKKKAPFIFQPFHFISFNSKFNPDKKINLAYKQELIFPVIDIVSDVRKTGYAILLTEILNKCINHFEENPNLYLHLKKMIVSFEHHSFNPIFGVFFIKELMNFFGIKPLDNYSEVNKHFSVANGRFQINEDDLITSNFPNKSFNQLLGMKIDSVFSMKLPVEKRRSILNVLLQYLSFHEILSHHQIQSIQVLQSIYD